MYVLFNSRELRACRHLFCFPCLSSSVSRIVDCPCNDSFFRRLIRLRWLREAQEVRLNQAILSAIVSAVIAGIFGLIGKLMDAKLKTVSVSTTSASVSQTVNSIPYPPYQPSTPTSYPPYQPGTPTPYPPYQPSTPTSYPPYQSRTTVSQTVTSASQSNTSFSFGRVLIHIGILQLVVNIVGFIVGFTVGVTRQYDAFYLSILFFGTISAIIGFAWVGARVNKAFRWKHLFFVAIGVAIVTLFLNSLVLQTSITLAALIFAFMQTFLAMGIGGAIASAFK
jgi:hypothetical protein